MSREPNGAKPHHWAYYRTAILFVAGLAGVIYEAALWGLYKRTPDPTLSLIFGAMMGISVTTWPKNGNGR